MLKYEHSCQWCYLNKLKLWMFKINGFQYLQHISAIWSIVELFCFEQRAEEGAEFVPDCVRSLPGGATDDQIVALPEVQEYKEATEEIRNEEETLDSVNRYKNSVKQMLLPKTL